MQPVNESKEQTKRWYKKLWGILLISFIVLFFGSALVVRFTTDPNKAKVSESTPTVTPAPVQNTKLPKYQVKVTGNDYADPTVRRITFTVTNIGEADGNPACNVDVSNEASTYTGYDYATWNTPLKPGEFKYYSELVVVTNEGAAYATKSRVSCAER